MKSGAYTISVIVDEQPLEEYQVETEGEKTSCWIASEEGKSFKIKVEQTENWSEHDSSFRVHLDGSKTKIESSLLPHNGTSGLISGKTISETQRAPFLFQVVTTTDEDTIDSAQELNDGFGSIEIRVYRGKLEEEDGVGPRDGVNALTSTFNELAIKENKVTHVCSLGAPIQIMNTAFRKFVYIDLKPLFTFCFKYRSKTLLQAMGVIKSSAGSPAPHRSRVNQLKGKGDISIIVISSDEEDEDTTDDEELEAAKKIREMEAALAEAKKAAEAKKSIKKKVVVKTEIEDVKPNIQHLEKVAPQARAQPSRKVKKEIE